METKQKSKYVYDLVGTGTYLKYSPVNNVIYLIDSFNDKVLDMREQYGNRLTPEHFRIKAKMIYIDMIDEKRGN